MALVSVKTKSGLLPSSLLYIPPKFQVNWKAPLTLTEGVKEESKRGISVVISQASCLRDMLKRAILGQVFKGGPSSGHGSSKRTLWVNHRIMKYDDYFFIFIFYKGFYFWFLSFFFSGPHPRHMEVLRLGGKSDLQLPTYATATAMPDP